MKKLLATLALACSLAFSCAHVVPIVECAVPAIVQIIETDFGQADWEDLIKKDVEQYGPSVVACVAQNLIQGTKSDATSQHAAIWLAANPQK